MQKNTNFIITLITTIALSGILMTQIYWVKTAYSLKEEQFDNSVRIAVKSVINQFQQKQYDSTFQQKLVKLAYKKDILTIDDYINANELDSLIHDELNCMAINSEYKYGVYSKSNKTIAMGSVGVSASELFSSYYQFSLGSIYKSGDYYLGIKFQNRTYMILHRMELWVVLSVVFVLILTVSFIFVIMTILHQKKVSEIKANFINNMTHEFKTPIATTTLAAEMIQKSEVINNPAKIKSYSSIILDENNRLQSQVEQVLQVAILESGKNQFKIKILNANRIIETVLCSFELRLKESNIIISENLDASNPYFMADRSHVINIFYNLIDNAIKYSSKNPIINISTYNSHEYVVLSVKDNGIGISKEYQKNIFKNLYRVPTGNIQDVRGFGLGLYYVKTIVDQFGGKIDLISEPGVGSNFSISFPKYLTKAKNHES